MNELSREGAEFPSHEDGVIIATAGSPVGLDLISLAWPSYQLDAQRGGDVRVSVDDDRSLTPALLQDLSAIAVCDFEEIRPTIMLRMVARGLLKEAAVTAAEAASEDAAGEVGGFLSRVASRAFAVATERADTRNWSTLPAELLLARFHLPPGRHTLRINYDGLHDRRELLEFDIEIRAGDVITHTVAILGNDEGDHDRFAAAAKGVRYVAPKSPDVKPS